LSVEKATQEDEAAPGEAVGSLLYSFRYSLTMEPAYAVSVFIAIFAIVNPIGTIPFFTTLTQDYSPVEQKQVASKAVMAATLTLLIFGLIGRYIFLLFSITIPAFRIAGGLLLFRIAFSMMFGRFPGTKATEAEQQESVDKEVVGIMPIGIPMLAGPGAISTVMLYISHGAILDTVMVFISVLVTMAIAYVFLTNADKISNRVGRVGSQAISRLMGLILATVAIQFLINGAHEIALEWIKEISAL
jgi:multiple antibiotic resistance protein